MLETVNRGQFEKKTHNGETVRTITVTTDHRALLSVPNVHQRNKSYKRRLLCWIDRLRPIIFTIKHMPGARMGLID